MAAIGTATRSRIIVAGRIAASILSRPAAQRVTV